MFVFCQRPCFDGTARVDVVRRVEALATIDGGQSRVEALFARQALERAALGITGGYEVLRRGVGRRRGSVPRSGLPEGPVRSRAPFQMRC